MPNPLHYKKVANVYAKRNCLKKSSGSNIIYDILDVLEKITRVIAALNRWVMGDSHPARSKKKIRRIKRYAKINKRTGMLILKRQKKIRALKGLKSAKKWSKKKKWLVI